MKLHFIKSPTGSPFFLAYNLGDVAEIESEEVAQKLLDAGIAETEEQKEQREKAKSGEGKKTATAKTKKEKATK